MVLLTSSTVSAIISAAIISLFTFLLFMVGYVLQQQSVNSLREAIKAPPPPKHTPTLPARFRRPENETETIETEGVEEALQDGIGQFLGDDGDTTSNFIEVGVEDATQQALSPPSRAESLAFILALAEPAALCSAAFFAESLGLQPSSTTTTQPRLVLLYPSTWETAASPLHIAALTLMRDMHEKYPVIFHPVEYVKGWQHADTISHLLGEMQRAWWDFDRMLYLRTPGMVVEATKVMDTLKRSNVRKSWTPMTEAVGSDPQVLMWERKRGFMMQRGDTSFVGSELPAGFDNASVEDSQSSPTADAAYILFDSLLYAESEGSTVLRKQYETGLRLVCQGRALLPGDEDRVELKRM
jgi:hypothetical protein